MAKCGPRCGSCPELGPLQRAVQHQFSDRSRIPGRSAKLAEIWVRRMKDGFNVRGNERRGGHRASSCRESHILNGRWKQKASRTA